jgi:Ni,Fe-hydrogenase I small subunit
MVDKTKQDLHTASVDRRSFMKASAVTATSIGIG